MSGYVEGFEPPIGYIAVHPPTAEEHYRSMVKHHESEKATGSRREIHRSRQWRTSAFLRWRASLDETARRRSRWVWAIERRRDAMAEHLREIAWLFARWQDVNERIEGGRITLGKRKGEPYSLATLASLQRGRKAYMRRHLEAIETFRAFAAQPCPGYHEWRQQFAVDAEPDVRKGRAKVTRLDDYRAHRAAPAKLRVVPPDTSA